MEQPGEHGPGKPDQHSDAITGLRSQVFASIDMVCNIEIIVCESFFRALGIRWERRTLSIDRHLRGRKSTLAMDSNITRHKRLLQSRLCRVNCNARFAARRPRQWFGRPCNEPQELHESSQSGSSKNPKLLRSAAGEAAERVVPLES